MPQLVRLYIRQVLIGFALSAVLVGVLLCSNTANLWHLVTATDAGPLAVFLLWLFNGIVLAGVQFGISIMRMAEDDCDNDAPGKGARQPLLLQPVTVRARPGKGQNSQR